MSEELRTGGRTRVGGLAPGLNSAGQAGARAMAGPDRLFLVQDRLLTLAQAGPWPFPQTEH